MGKLPPCWLPYLLAVPLGNAGNRPSTSFYWSLQWQAVVLQDLLVAAMVNTCVQHTVYGMINWVETGSLLNTEDDAVGVCNWYLTKGSSGIAKFNLNPLGLNLATSFLIIFFFLFSGSWQVCKLCWVLMKCPHLHAFSVCQELQDEHFLLAVAPGTLGTVTWESNNQLPSESVGNIKSWLRQIWQVRNERWISATLLLPGFCLPWSHLMPGNTLNNWFANTC